MDGKREHGGGTEGWLDEREGIRKPASSLPEIETESALRTNEEALFILPSARQRLVKSASEAEINLCGGELGG